MRCGLGGQPSIEVARIWNTGDEPGSWGAPLGCCRLDASHYLAWLRLQREQ